MKQSWKKNQLHFCHREKKKPREKRNAASGICLHFWKTSWLLERFYKKNQWNKFSKIIPNMTSPSQNHWQSLQASTSILSHKTKMQVTEKGTIEVKITGIKQNPVHHTIWASWWSNFKELTHFNRTVVQWIITSLSHDKVKGLTLKCIESFQWLLSQPGSLQFLQKKQSCSEAFLMYADILNQSMVSILLFPLLLCIF